MSTTTTSGAIAGGARPAAAICSHATAVHLVHVYAATILDYASPPPALYELRGRHGKSGEDELAQWREAFIDLGW